MKGFSLVLVVVMRRSALYAWRLLASSKSPRSLFSAGYRPSSPQPVRNTISVCSRRSFWFRRSLRDHRAQLYAARIRVVKTSFHGSLPELRTLWPTISCSTSAIPKAKARSKGTLTTGRYEMHGCTTVASSEMCLREDHVLSLLCCKTQQCLWLISKAC